MALQNLENPVVEKPNGLTPGIVSVIILTHNEAHHIGRAIDSIKPFAKEVFIIDSGSSDGTIDIAAAKGARILHNPWKNHATQFQWGLDNAPVSGEWIMRLDADEIIENDLAQLLTSALSELPDDVTGVNLNRKHIFMGRWIKHGGRYPVTLLRIWRTGLAHVEDRWMDEHIILNSGRAVTFDGGFSDVNLGDLSFFTNKHNKYATLEAVEVLKQRYQLINTAEAFQFQGPEQAKRKRVLKERLYNKLPLGLGPILYFLYRYIFQLGILDGKEGAIYHGLQGLWYRFLVDAKVLELNRAIENIPEKPAKVQRLKEITGLKLN
ncbi:hypothetical protein MMA231_04152 (plasmid) [Asticcacaulis sp. MM231]|uniref:glycosyltransferase family 2 protein n=1 Tax=Asticcacaulis sp. MM231 TaxID=3157666 RepID=UPI0032D58760